MADKTLQATIKLKDEMTKVLSDINKNLSDFQDEITLANDSLNDTEKALGGTKSGFDDFGECTDRATDGVKTFSDTLNGIALQELGSKFTESGKKIISAINEIVGVTRDWEAEVSQQEFMYNNFDSSTKKVIDSLAKESEVLALTEQQYENNATAVAAFYRSAGQTTKTINEMLPSTMQLVNDMSAFADVNIDTAMSDFKSALVGNFNALDKYGVAVNVATINVSDYAKELGKNWDEMSLAEKQQAILNETMRQSSDYYGLAQQEASEYGKQSDYMNQTIKEATSAIGNSLLPVLVPLVQWVANVAKHVATWAQENPKLAQTIMIIVASVGALLFVGGSLLTFLGMAAVAIGAISTAGGIMAVVFSPITLTILAVAAAMGILVGAGVWLYNNWDMVCQKATELKNWVIDQFNILRNQCTDAINIMNDSISNAWDSIVEKFQTSVESATSWWNNLTSTISNNPIKAVVDFVKPAFTGSNSHAYGLNKVPYDGYTAKLHQGERVLTASEARRQDNNSGNGVTIAKIADTVIIREEADINKIANEFARKLKSAQLTQA